MSSFDDALNAFNMALNDYLNGDSGPVQAVFSRHDDVTLCNPVRPPRRGRDDVERGAAEPSSHFTHGQVSPPPPTATTSTSRAGAAQRTE